MALISGCNCAGRQQMVQFSITLIRDEQKMTAAVRAANGLQFNLISSHSLFSLFCCRSQIFIVN